jgi:holo-[acyl-carrier protein] synthase
MIVGLGVDIIEISRIKKAVQRFGDDFLNHVFTPDEIQYAKKHKFPYQHYAGRFAAKEAVFKALGNDAVSWKDLNIVNDALGKPVCTYRKKGFKKTILLTISHCKEYAVAQAIVTA